MLYKEKILEEKLNELRLKGLSEEEILIEYNEFIYQLENGIDYFIDYNETSSIVSKTNIDRIQTDVENTIAILDINIDEINRRKEELREINNNIISAFKINSEILFNNSLKLNFDMNKNYKEIETVDSSKIREENNIISLTKLEHSIAQNPTNIYVSESNGLPGDTKRGYYSTTGEVKFVGEHNPMLNIKNVFGNGMFAYEKIMVDSEVYRDCDGEGFTYIEGIDFINNKDDKLNVKIIAEYENPKEANTLSFNDCNSVNYIIKSINIKNDDGAILKVIRNSKSKNYNLFNFPTTNVKKIEINLEQRNVEKCSIVNYHLNSKIKNNIITIGSITDIGCTLDTKTNKVKHPTLLENIDINKNAATLFNKKYFKRLINANRQSVTIGNCILACNKYETSGFITKKFAVESGYIDKIIFNALENVPLDTEINYQFSLNNDVWHDIKPLYRARSNDVHTLIINSLITSAPANFKCIISDSRVKEFYIRAELKSKSKIVTPTLNKIDMEIFVHEE